MSIHKKFRNFNDFREKRFKNEVKFVFLLLKNYEINAIEHCVIIISGYLLEPYTFD